MNLSELFKTPFKLKGGATLNLRGFSKRIIDKSLFPYKFIKIPDINYTVKSSSDYKKILGHIDIKFKNDNSIVSIFINNSNLAIQVNSPQGRGSYKGLLVAPNLDLVVSKGASQDLNVGDIIITTSTVGAIIKTNNSIVIYG